MRVVDEHDQGQSPRQVGNQDGEPLEQSQARRLSNGSGSPNGSGAPDHCSEIVEEAAAELRYLFGAEVSEVALERL